MIGAIKNVVRLTGSHLQRLDERNRLAVPTKLVPALKELVGVTGEEPIEVVITMTKQRRLGIYPRQDFLRMIEGLEAASETDSDAEELLTSYLNYMQEETLDKQNRVKIPEVLSDAIELAGEVVVMGSGKFIEVVNKKVYNAQMEMRVSLMKEQDLKAKAAARDRAPE